MPGEIIQVDCAQTKQVAEAWKDDLVVLDNYAVYALAGNANNDNLQQRIMDVKGGRSAVQPVAWTRPFDERVLATIDIDKIEHPAMQDLLREPDELTARLGGMAFLLAVADQDIRLANNIPKSVMPEKEGTVMIWSPEGITTTAALIKAATDLGVEPTMTSANKHEEHESVTATGAHSFIKSTQYGLRRPSVMVISKPDELKDKPPLGSFPIVAATPEGFVITRSGCFAPEITALLFDDYPIILSAAAKAPNYPEHVFRMVDLPPDVQAMRGAELRLGLLAYLGWSDDMATSIPGRT